jgi:hypothetical protein
MPNRPEPPPWGALITDALHRARLSAREAARRAGISEGRWRQITGGYQVVSAGVYAPVRGPAATLARMAVRRWLRSCSGEGHPPDAATVERVLGVARLQMRATEVGGGWRVARTGGRLRLELDGDPFVGPPVGPPAADG